MSNLRSLWSQPDVFGDMKGAMDTDAGDPRGPQGESKVESPAEVPEPPSGSSGSRTVSSGVQPVSLYEEEDETGIDEADDIAPAMEELVRSMTPSWGSPDGVFVAGSDSVYVGGRMPAGEASNA